MVEAGEEAVAVSLFPCTSFSPSTSLSTSTSTSTFSSSKVIQEAVVRVGETDKDDSMLSSSLRQVYVLLCRGFLPVTFGDVLLSSVQPLPLPTYYSTSNTTSNTTSRQRCGVFGGDDIMLWCLKHIYTHIQAHTHTHMYPYLLLHSHSAKQVFTLIFPPEHHTRTTLLPPVYISHMSWFHIVDVNIVVV